MIIFAIALLTVLFSAEIYIFSHKIFGNKIPWIKEETEKEVKRRLTLIFKAAKIKRQNPKEWIRTKKILNKNHLHFKRLWQNFKNIKEIN